MNAKVSLVLMLLFLGLGYLAFFEPLRTQVKEDEKAEREAHVVWLKNARLESISVQGEKPPVELRCATKEKHCPLDSTGEWTIEGPAKTNADPSAVGTLASSLLNLTHNGKLDFEHGYSEAEFGLDHPRATVQLRISGSKDPLTLRFGKASPVSPDVYLSVSDDPKHLYQVPNYLPGMVDQDAFHWRNKRLFPLAEATAVSEIHWKSKTGDVRAARDGDGWKLEKPIQARASKIMLEGLGSTLSYAAAKSIFSESRATPEAKKAVSGAPELEVTFKLNGDGEHKLRLYPKASSTREKLALVDELAPVYAVDAGTFDRFAKDITEYRQRAVLSDAERSAIDEVRFVFPRDKKELTVTLQKGLWQPGAGDKTNGMLSQPRITGFLDQLRDANFKAFLPVKGASPEAKAWRSSTPDLKVELKTNGQTKAEASFLVFERKQALTESENEVRTVGGDAFLKFLPVRLSDLNEDANRPVVTEKVDQHGHSVRIEQRGK